MSVINSMLRDLDRRQAPSPFQANAAVKASVQLAPAQPNRMTPRSAIFFCVLIALVILSWGQRSKEAVDSKEAIETTASIQSVDAKIEALSSQPKPVATEKNSTVQLPTSEQENRRLTESFATTRREYVPIGSEAASMPPTVAANDSVNRLASQKTSSAEKQKSETQTVSQSDTQVSEARTSAPIIKQERNSADDVNAERYQLARNALAQNQPQRAYELLRDNPPALASNSDYHAVLAAAEQQLGHYAEASLRYQQLLMLDQNQASWWLGLALSIDQNRSLDGAHRNNEALAAYQRAAQLNSLPEAARQYAAARIAALNHSAEQ